jgi:hypothetical protein
LASNQGHEVARLAKLLTKQNPSSNDSYEDVYMRERRGFSSSPNWPPKNSPRCGFFFTQTDSKKSLKYLGQKYMGLTHKIR